MSLAYIPPNIIGISMVARLELSYQCYMHVRSVYTS